MSEPMSGPMRKLEKDQVWLDIRKNLLTTVPQNGMLLLANCEFPVMGVIEMNTVTTARKSKKCNGRGDGEKDWRHVFENPLLFFTFSSVNHSKPVMYWVLSLNSFFLDFAQLLVVKISSFRHSASRFRDSYKYIRPRNCITSRMGTGISLLTYV